MKKLALLAALVSTIALQAGAAKPADKTDAGKDGKADEARMSADTLKGLELRGIGPAYNSGRVADIAVTPGAHHRYFVAAASGGVWRTDNGGTTWKPIFDDQGSFSIGCLALDPGNPNVLWVGTGENNSQRSVAFGDGVYKTLDGGTTWTNAGLKDSEHIGMIAIDPRDTNVVWVAAQGPLWRAGGDRGLYRTTDGGGTWQKMLDISPDTGISEVRLDPRDPDTMYAVAYQRRRHVWTLINGGPESGLYKSTDAGVTWRKVTKGLPEVEIGRIGLAISPADPEVLYAIVEAQRDEGGVFRSTDRGESWGKRSKYTTVSGQYYNELFADPKDVDTVYSMDTWLHYSADGGTTFTKVGEKYKHVDNHAMWIDPGNSAHWLVGCDGGVYSTYDRGANWEFVANLPITQFYRVSVDTRTPFYTVCGGTQDNNTLCGPSRTLDRSGISNEDWFVTVGGDGYETVIDPENPDILYSLWQYGGLVRYDRASGETMEIRPQEAPGDPADRWNWDTPLIISPHLHTRLYVASQRVFRSDDRGDSWRSISGDLSRQLDRNRIPVMGKIWGMDAVDKNQSTSDYGNIVSLIESPLVEGLIYAGTDDGLIQVTEDGGATWRRIDGIKGVPERTYVSRLEASRHDGNTVYAAFDNHKMGDFTPYLFVSRDRGRSWTSMRGDLPDREVVYAVAQDHVDSKLLFAGTEFGLYVTVDEGAHWVRLQGKFPTIQVRDLDIQRRENDLAVASFGRGFYILDDYTPLRSITEQALAEPALLFPVRDAALFIEMTDRKDSRGDAFYTAPNPPYGALITYYLRDGLKTLKEQRIDAEKEAGEAKQEPPLPSIAELHAEDQQVEPQLLLVVRDAAGEVVRRVVGDRKKGLHRAAWDLRYPAETPVDLTPPKEFAPWEQPERGPLVVPGTYSVTLEQQLDGVVTALAPPQEFKVTALDLSTLRATNLGEAQAFKNQVRDLRRAVSGSLEAAKAFDDRIKHCRQAILDTPAADPALLAEAERLGDQLDSIQVALRGDPTKEARNVFQPPSLRDRVERIASDQYYVSSAPTKTQRDAYGWAAEGFTVELGHLEQVERDLEALEARLEAAGGPWTPGRLPDWKGDRQTP